MKEWCAINGIILTSKGLSYRLASVKDLMLVKNSVKLDIDFLKTFLTHNLVHIIRLQVVCRPPYVVKSVYYFLRLKYIILHQGLNFRN
jgi:hypothetical protein